jgi:hypothetical protein
VKKAIIFIPVLVLLTITLSAQSYIRAGGDSLNPRIYANTGIFRPNLTTSLRIDSRSGLGTDISLEDDFNFEPTLSVFYAQAVVRAKQRSQFVLSYTNINRTSSLEIDQDISIADTTFYLGAELNLQFDVNYYAFTWRYAFFNKANWNAGLSVGLRAAQFKFKADASANGATYGVSESITAPAILFGLHGSGYLTERLLGRYSFEFFDLSIDGLDINVLETRASLEYFIIENVGLGVAYSTSSYRVSELPLNNNLDGRVLFDFSGVNLFLSARF